MKYLIIVGAALGAVWLVSVYTFQGPDSVTDICPIAEPEEDGMNGGVPAQIPPAPMTEKSDCEEPVCPEEITEFDDVVVDEEVNEIYEETTGGAVPGCGVSDHVVHTERAVQGTSVNEAIGLAGGSAGSFAGRRGGRRRARRGRGARPVPARTATPVDAGSSFRSSAESPFSTFSIDVDTASYSEMRRRVNEGGEVRSDHVRTEEFLNYFTYSLPQPDEGEEVSIWTESTDCPWNSENRLLRISVGAPRIHESERKKANLVFLIDTSGSMDSRDKIELLKSSMTTLLATLTENDSVGIVTYSDTAQTVLPSTRADKKELIQGVIDQLSAGGSTNGEAGLQLAYDMAKRNKIEDGINRVILATDGDFNVGVSDTTELAAFARHQAAAGLAISVLGFGLDNLKRGLLEQVAQKADGHYAYIDSSEEAKKVFGTDLVQNLQLTARDVKIQVEFNPAQVSSWRLIGYENRELAKKDFADDKKDASDMGPGSQVTALYELILQKGEARQPVNDRRYVKSEVKGDSDELLFLKVRYKRKKEAASRLIVKPVSKETHPLAKASVDFRFAAAVAGFAGRLSRDADRSRMSWSEILRLAEAGVGRDRHGRRAEFLSLVRTVAKRDERNSRSSAAVDRVSIAVTRGLAWLAHNQNADGSFSVQGMDWQDEGAPQSGNDKAPSSMNERIETTALALLAYVGSGHTHRRGEFRQTVARGAKWLKDIQKAEGGFAVAGKDRLQADAAATLALVEIFSMTCSPIFKKSADNAVNALNEEIASLHRQELAWSPQLMQYLVQLKNIFERFPHRSVAQLRLTWEEVKAARFVGKKSSSLRLFLRHRTQPKSEISTDGIDAVKLVVADLCRSQKSGIQPPMFEFQTLSMVMDKAAPHVRGLWEELGVGHILGLAITRGPDRGAWPASRHYSQTAATALAILTLQFDTRLL